MKQILLLSDNHGHIENGLNDHMKWADEIWHAGDMGSIETKQWMDSFQKPVRGVYGNIDDREIRHEYPEDNIFTIEEVKVWITHIGGYPGRYTARVKSLFQTINPMLFICGHSHIVCIQEDPKFRHWVFNPGACGNQGFHQIKTALKFVIDKNHIRATELIQLGKRGNSI